jgi:hypothetical protein
MLPALPSPTGRPRPLAVLLLAPLLALLLSLAGCGGGGQPPRTVLLDALALQIRLTQASIADALGLPADGVPQVSRVRVEEQSRITIGEGSGLRLSGRFDWRLADDPIRVDSPFELYLQRGERGQSWRLARPIRVGAEGAGTEGAGTVAAGQPESGVQGWLIDPLPLPAGPRG